MTKKSMMKQLTKIAVELDVDGYEKEAETVAKIMTKIANVLDEDFNRMADPEMYGDSETSNENMMLDMNNTMVNFQDETEKAIVDSIADKITMMMPESNDEEILQMAIDMTTDILDRIKRLSSDRNI